MRPRERARGKKIEIALEQFEASVAELAGIDTVQKRTAFIEQVLESIRRVRYIQVVLERDIHAGRADPDSDLFDPIKAAAFCKRAGNLEEACWLVFLFVHFGKSPRGAWGLIRDVYGALGSGARWDWSRVSSNPASFRQWLAANQGTLTGPGARGRFGNHRKYQSIDAWKPTGTGAAVESYVTWVGPRHSHRQLFADVLARCDGDSVKGFDYLFESLDAVRSFGRMARFDYLTMLSKLGLVNIEPGRIYIEGATGPLKGAALLFGERSPKQLEQLAGQLGQALGVGMQVVEDAICNWQKSPGKFVAFRG